MLSIGLNACPFFLNRRLLRVNNHAGIPLPLLFFSFVKKNKQTKKHTKTNKLKERQCGGSGRESVSLFFFVLNMIIAFIRNAKLAI